LGARAREHDAPGRQRDDAEHAPVAVEHHHIDRCAHAERLDGPAAREHDGLARTDAIAHQEPSTPLRVCLGERHEPAADHAHKHRVTVATTNDTSRWARQDSNLRHEG
jgi:hypothetical protein